MHNYIDITFDCTPLRSIGRLDIPLDASPGFERLCIRIRKAIQEHGQHNSYYLHGGKCVFHLTNDDRSGMLTFGFEGTVLTDATDQKARACDLRVTLLTETCDWVTSPIVDWFGETVERAVLVEFDRYLASEGVEQTARWAVLLETEMEAQYGYMGMGI
jgi:hypothetical protein